MRVVGYVRVSTDRQVEEGLGLEVQERAIRAWARSGGHRVVALARDEGVSGCRDEAGRRGLSEALGLIEDGKADALVVHHLTRLARLLHVQEAALARVWMAGGRAFAVDMGEVHQDDPDDPMRTAMRQMVGVFSQLERASIAARLRAGRRLKAERGGFAYGAPGYGWQAENRELVVDQAEALVVARIGELHAEGSSLRTIARTLDAEGHRPRRGERWHPTVLARLVRRLEAGAAA